MKMRKVVAILAACTMLAASFTGCAKKADTGSSDTQATATPAASTDSASDTTASDEIVTLKWITVGNGMPTNYDAWQKNINAYLGEKIGVNIDMEVVSWGDWDTRRNIIVNSGENFDILFTDGNKYNASAKLGAFLDITDLVQSSASDLYNYIPADYWNAVKVDGKVYAVPTYKDSSATQYFVWDKAIVDKYGIDYQNSTTLASLTDKLTEVTKGEGTAPFVLSLGGADVVIANYDKLGAGLAPLGVRFDDDTVRL